MRILIIVDTQVHHVCSAGRGPCLDKLRMVKAQTALMTGSIPMMDPEWADLEAEFPLSASCAHCKDPNMAKEDLNRCSQCKLVWLVA